VGLRLGTVSSEDEFASLAGWDDLVRAMPRPSPYLLHGWLIEWWRHYGGRAELAVHVAHRDERLVAALPLCTRRRAGLRVTEFLGGSWAVLADALIAPGERPSLIADLAELATSARHDYADLFGLPGSSRLVTALPSLHVLERLEAPVLDLTAPWEEIYRAKFSSKTRSERRRRLRQLETLGPVAVSVARSREELEGALDDAFRIHVLRWKGRRDPSGFATQIGGAFHRAALLRLAEIDVPRLVRIRVAGSAIAFALALHLEGRAYGVTMAFDPDYARFAPGYEAKLQSVELAAAEGITRVELLGADAPHKRRLTDRHEPVHQAIGLAKTLRGQAAAGTLVHGIRLRRRLKRSPIARRLYYAVPRFG
jgi:CelD/BcsL family acetyltransferase involved in cellulose biosynthesis